MKSGLFAGFIAVSLIFAATAAASAPIAENPIPAEAMPQKNAQAARPFTAVLRYGPGTTSACQSFSDNSSAICLLLALHVMQLSQKRVTETKL